MFSKESSLFTNIKHKNKITFHWIFNTLGLVAIIIAYAVIYYSKELNKKPHLATWHGLIGLITVIYTFIQYLAGHNLTILNGLFRKITNISYGSLAIAHATSGTVLFVLICTSMTLGIYSNWFSNTTPFYVWYFSFALTALFGLIVCNQVTSKYVKGKLINNLETHSISNIGSQKKQKKIK